MYESAGQNNNRRLDTGLSGDNSKAAMGALPVEQTKIYTYEQGRDLP